MPFLPPSPQGRPWPCRCYLHSELRVRSNSVVSIPEDTRYWYFFSLGQKAPVIRCRYAPNTRIHHYLPISHAISMTSRPEPFSQYRATSEFQRTHNLPCGDHVAIWCRFRINNLASFLLQRVTVARKDFPDLSDSFASQVADSSEILFCPVR